MCVLSIWPSDLIYDLQGVSLGSISFKFSTEITAVARSVIDVADFARDLIGLPARVKQILKYLKLVQNFGGLLIEVDIVIF